MGNFDRNNYLVEVNLIDNMTDPRWEQLILQRPSLKEYKTIIRKNPFIPYSPQAEAIIRFFIDYRGGLIKPDRWGFWEPINKVFDDSSIMDCVRALASTSGGVDLKKKYTYDAEIKNNTFGFIWDENGDFIDAQVPLPDYLTTIRFYFPGKKNIDLSFLTRLMNDMRDEFHADNGRVYYQATNETIAEIKE